MEVLLLLLGLLYVNIPSGYNAPYGLVPYSTTLFRSLWAYPELAISPGVFRLCAVLVFLALWAAYLFAAAKLTRSRPGEATEGAMVILSFAVLFNIELAIAFPPVLSGDVYHYALFGRIAGLYHMNPYVVPGDALHGDPFFPLALWRDMTTQYGPTWTLLSAAIAALPGGSVLGTVIAFKLAAAAFDIAAALLVWRLARRLQGDSGTVALLLFAWNPLILIESAGSGHNDIAMIALALLGVSFAIDGRPLAGLASLLVSAMVKYLSLLLVVLYVAHVLSRHRRLRQVALLTFQMVLVCGLALGVLYAPFLPGIDSPRQLVAQMGLNPMRNPIIPVLAAAVGHCSPAAAAWVPGALYLGFAVLLLLLAAKVTTSGADWRHVLTRFGVASLVFTYGVFGGSFPWYLISPTSAAVLGPPTRSNRILLAICIGLGLGFMTGYAKLGPV